MAGEFDAVYEDGVFRPTGPVDVPAGATVHLAVVPATGPGVSPLTGEELVAHIRARASQRPKTAAMNDGLIVSENVDRILYGTKGDPGDVR